MPRERPLETYPNPQYTALIQRVIQTQQPFTVPCTRAQAASLRGELYAWRRACERNRAHADTIGIPVEDLRQVAFRVNEAGLEAILAASLPGPKLITDALGITPTLASPASAALEALRAQGLVEANDGGE